MAIWDDIYNGIQGIYTFITVALAVMLQTAIDGITGIVSGIAKLITDALGAIADIITYPIIAVAQAILEIISHIITPFVGLFANITDTGAYITTTIVSILSVMFDAAWMLLIITGVGFVVIVRIYHYVKDIEILGNKV